MARGRKPKPTFLKILDGNPSRRPFNAAEPKPRRGIPDPPDVLQGRALEEWHRITVILDDCGAITHADLSLIAVYCQAWDNWCDATEKLQQTGPMMAGKTGVPVVSPLMRLQTQATATLKATWQELGLSPISRVKLQADISPEKDSLEEFLRA